MPRYHFHIFNRTGHLIDDEGAEVGDMDAARARAIAAIRSIIADEAIRGCIDLDGHIDIADDNAVTRLSVAFAEAFELHLPTSRSRRG